MEACMLFFTTFYFFLISSFPLFLSQPDEEYRECQPSPCGGVGKIDYPFWSDESLRPNYCGRPGFQLHCPQDEHNYPSIQIGSRTFNVTEIDLSTYKMRLVPTDFANNDCSPLTPVTNTSVSISSDLFHYDKPSVKNLTLFYNCSQDYSIRGVKLSCQHRTSSSSNSNIYAFYSAEVVNDPLFPDLIKNCKHHVQLPVSTEIDAYHQHDSLALQEALSKGFRVQYGFSESCKKCRESDGICGSTDTSQFICYCLDGYHLLNCPVPSGSFAFRNKLIVAGVTAVLAIGATALLCLCKTKSWRQIIGLCNTYKDNQNIEAFIRNHGALALTRYKFADVKKMTDSFKDKLGQGGYGSVYKGKLLNGRPVAVKLLKASKENGEDFINEVASISRTSHVNVVTLLGFCFEGKQKALLYKFMSNGSLDKFIYNNAGKNNLCLTWENLYQIAIGTARGLEYLHRGCNTRILHFDIKPHNILLDESFHPKISDFGLAKLCLKKESIISISEARRTIGYLAPEVWNRNIGGVSQKSDVYSYGMMLLDMVGGRKNMNVETICSTDKYFPDYIYDQLEQHSSLGCNRPNNIEENGIAKRMTIVGLWCIQTIPSQRPTMSGAIEMLEKRPELLEMPPRPVMPSPSRSDIKSSTTTNTIT